ncbi:hypothetical protein MRB53_009777 [Persea americana]|uniref:Uncharacterized protein n=1 Tax=Persea americana TaxID=3435 RepID=A0ACC2LQC1_PERAE|nr:hypothetical protein MRB53_009777 [Persea americana]
MQMASLLLDIGNTQNAVEQEPYVDVEMEELMLMSNVRRKRPCPLGSKKNAKMSKFDDSLERIVIILEGEKNEEERKEKERKEEEMKEKERKDEERKEEERKEKERKEEEIKEKALALALYVSRFKKSEPKNESMQHCGGEIKHLPTIPRAIMINHSHTTSHPKHLARRIVSTLLKLYLDIRSSYCQYKIALFILKAQSLQANRIELFLDNSRGVGALGSAVGLYMVAGNLVERKFDLGVYSFNLDAEQGKVTVAGNVDPNTLVKKLQKKDKHAQLWSSRSPE